MADSNGILLVIPPIFRTNYSIKSRRNIETGALVISSYLKNQNVPCILLSFDDLADEDIKQCLLRTSYRMLGISVTSSFGFNGALRVATISKEIYPQIPVVLGGQLARSASDEIMAMFKAFDMLCVGEGEDTALDLWRWLQGELALADVRGILFRQGGSVLTSAKPVYLSPDKWPRLDYSLYPQDPSYIYTVEESRGCMGCCSFCNSAGVCGRHYRVRPAELIVEDVVDIVKKAPRLPIHLSFGCSTFGWNAENTRLLLDELLPLRDKIILQLYLRVDCPWDSYIEHLSKMQLSSAFVGFESAHPEILARMRKTTSPDVYITRMRTLINSFAEHDIPLWAHYVLGYLGETPDTLGTTLDFILSTRGKVPVTTCLPLVAYAGSEIYRNLNRQLIQWGGSVVSDEREPIPFYKRLNPSVHFSHDQMNALSILVAKICNDENHFQKVYGWRYLETGASPDQFRRALRNTPTQELLFNFDSDTWPKSEGSA